MWNGMDRWAKGEFAGESGETEVLRLRCAPLRMTMFRFILLGLLVGVAAGQGAGVGEKQSLRVSSRAEYGAELARMSVAVEACRGRATACGEKAVAADEVVSGGGEQEFEVHWFWLRAALRQGADAKAEDRDGVLASAGERLQEDASELKRPGMKTDPAGAKATLDAVLGRREFGQVRETRWWQLIFAKGYGFLERWLGRVGDVIPWSPWMGVAMEWGVLGAAAVGLMVWAFRLSKQQRVGFAAEREAAPAWQAESGRWAERAEEEARKGEWREAVHCLYWSAIVMLEGQKLWRQNRARTPREYVALLEAGSTRRRVLGGLTGVFERIWYGIRPATGDDYEKASALLEKLRVG